MVTHGGDMDNAMEPRQEALYLLSVIERGESDWAFLSRARRRFISLVWELAFPKGQIDLIDLKGNDISVCLLLPLPEPYSWLLEYGTKNIYAKIMRNSADDIYETVIVKWGKTLPIAMLRAWLELRED